MHSLPEKKGLGEDGGETDLFRNFVHFFLFFRRIYRFFCSGDEFKELDRLFTIEFNAGIECLGHDDTILVFRDEMDLCGNAARVRVIRDGNPASFGVRDKIVYRIGFGH